MDDVLIAAQLLQPHRAAGMKLLGGDAHFTAQAELAANPADAFAWFNLGSSLAAQGLYASGTTPAEFSAQIAREIDKMKQVAAYAKIKLD